MTFVFGPKISIKTFNKQFHQFYRSDSHHARSAAGEVGRGFGVFEVQAMLQIGEFGLGDRSGSYDLHGKPGNFIFRCQIAFEAYQKSFRLKYSIIREF